METPSVDFADRRRSWLFAAIIVLAAFAVYWPALHGGWLWDDELDVTGNSALRDAAGLWRIWFHPVGLYDYYPIKYTVQWLQWQLWGADTTGYHATNIALHALSSLLFWRLLSRLAVAHAWLGGLIFAVHPLAVESVAWITELKNTLSLPFLLLAFLRYLDFDTRGRRGALVASVLLFAAAALCKTSVVMFPVALLLYQLWKHGRLTWARGLSTAPFFVVSLVLGLVTLWFQHHRAIGGEEAGFDPVGGPLARIACAGSSLAFYAGKTLLPTNLMPIYPQWTVNPPSPLLFLPWLVLAAAVTWFWIQRGTWGRHALLGTGWFVLHLLPVLGFVPISSQRFTWVMDHLAYLSLLGAVGLATAALAWLPRRAVLPVTLPVCVVLGLVSHRHAATFRSEQALWEDNVAKNPQAWMAHYNLGKIAGDAGRSSDAIGHYRAALRARPAYPEAWNNLGMELRNAGRNAEAIEAFENAIRSKPAHYAAHNNLAAALAAAGRIPDAIARVQEALRINPRFAAAHRNLGNILTRTGRNREAIEHFRQALALQPHFPEVENDLGVALANSGHNADAIAAFRRALQQRPDYAEALNNLGSTLRDTGQPAEALAPLERALALRPEYVSARYNLGCALLDAGRTADAVAAFEHTLRLDPSHADALFSLGNIRATAGDDAAALAHYDRATTLRPDFAAAHRNAGIVLARSGRIAEAVTRYRAAVTARPDFADAHLSLAQAYQALGQMSEAIASYEAARKLRPELPPIER